VRADANARPEYLAAFAEIAARVAMSIESLPKRALPVRMFVAGGAALYFYTGERISRDIDASFSRRIALPENLEAAYRDADGAARLLYLDRQYNDTLGLLHEEAYDDSKRLTVPGVDSRVLEVRLLSPLDLAVTKLGRFTSQDREDIAALGRRGLVRAGALRKRAAEALSGYVGDTRRVQQNIEHACRVVEDLERRLD
jgi:hypothetical protein